MKKQTKRGRSVIRPLTVQLLIAAPVLTLLLCLAVARLILSGVVPEERITLCAGAIADVPHGDNRIVIIRTYYCDRVIAAIERETRTIYEQISFFLS